MTPRRLTSLLLLLTVVALATLFSGGPVSAQSATVDYDSDNDGLIEVSNLAQLDAIRYDLDGDGAPTGDNGRYATAFPNAAAGLGCPATCAGYELTTNLDFDTNGNGQADAGDAYWNNGAGWQPIGTGNNTFRAIFDGGLHTISNLFIDRDINYIGLFGRTWSDGNIKRIGLINFDVAGGRNSNFVGGLVGETNGAITASYVTGRVLAKGDGVGGLAGRNGGQIIATYAASRIVSGKFNVGGLVGVNTGAITASYATSDHGVFGGDRIGGLVGVNSRATITASYSTGAVGSSNIVRGGGSDFGGLLGRNEATGTITASYWDTQTSGQSASAGGEGKTTQELQSLTSNTGIYATWDNDVWDFGTSSEYPALRGVAPAEPVHAGDRAAIVALYNATNGGNWSNNTNWLSNRPLGEWRGVTTDNSGRVTELFLYGNQLSGSIPAELGNLTNLGRLLLSSNQLSGSIPPELGSLSNLRDLWLHGNQLSGSIPPELGSLSNLERLGLSDNQLSGSIPAELGNLTNLGRLHLYDNRLSGSIPAELRSLSNLEGLYLYDNRLSGSIPPGLGSLSNLRFLLLHGNRLSGSIPARLGSLVKLEWLTLSGNGFTGPLPSGLTQLTALENFAFGNNNGLCAPTDQVFQAWLQGIPNNDLPTSELPGVTPLGPNCVTVSPDRAALVALYNATNGGNWSNNTNWLGNRPLDDWHGVTTDNSGRVTKLVLSDNRLSGQIPPELGSLSNLRGLWLNGNQLSGSIPTELGSLSNLENLYLNGNQLSGSIPPELGSLSNLFDLRLYDNQLSGSIPPELGSLSNLRGLNLDDNQLTGSIPARLGSLGKLQWLILSGNGFTGALPAGLTQLTALVNFAFGNNSGGLCAPTDAAFQTWLQGIADVGGPNCVTVSPDRAALVALYNATNGGNWSNNTNWLSNRPLGEWHGVTTDNEGRVSWLDLNGNQLSGSIPAELGSLSNLRVLYLYDNQLTGAIPTELRSLSNLEELFLDGNQLSGQIPPELRSLSNLEGLSLSSNRLSGAIPAWLGKPIQPGGLGPQRQPVERVNSGRVGKPIQPGVPDSQRQPVERGDSSAIRQPG